MSVCSESFRNMFQRASFTKAKHPIQLVSTGHESFSCFPRLGSSPLPMLLKSPAQAEPSLTPTALLLTPGPSRAARSSLPSTRCQHSMGWLGTFHGPQARRQEYYLSTEKDTLRDGRALGVQPSPAPAVGLGGAHLFAVLLPQQVSEGAVGLLECAQLLQEKFLLPRQGVDVRAGHLFLLEDSKQSHTGRERREEPAGEATKETSEVLVPGSPGRRAGPGGEDRLPGGGGPGRVGLGSSVWESAAKAGFLEEARQEDTTWWLILYWQESDGGVIPGDPWRGLLRGPAHQGSCLRVRPCT